MLGTLENTGKGLPELGGEEPGLRGLLVAGQGQTEGGVGFRPWRLSWLELVKEDGPESPRQRLCPGGTISQLDY